VETKTSLIEIMKYSDSVIVILFEGNKDPVLIYVYIFKTKVNHLPAKFAEKHTDCCFLL